MALKLGTIQPSGVSTNRLAPVGPLVLLLQNTHIHIVSESFKRWTMEVSAGERCIFRHQF